MTEGRTTRTSASLLPDSPPDQCERSRRERGLIGDGSKDFAEVGVESGARRFVDPSFHWTRFVFHRHRHTPNSRPKRFE